MSSLLPHLEHWLGQAAIRTLKRERPYVITVSGAMGKSSTKQAVAAVLHADDQVNQTRVSAKNYNNELGVPLTVFDMPAPGRSIPAWCRLLLRAFLISHGIKRTGIKTFVFEMGGDKPGDMDYLLNLAQPDLAVVTAVMPNEPDFAPAHTANFSSMEALIEEEALPVKRLGTQGIAVLNADDPRVFAMRHHTDAHILTFGEAETADIRILSNKVRCEPGTYGNVPRGLEIKIQVMHRVESIFIPDVFGSSAAYALAAALGVAVALDIPTEQYADFQKYFHPMNGRVRIIPGVKYTTLLDDTYNASPAAVVAALRDLGSLELNSTQRRVACLGEMRELGTDTELLHRRMGVEAAKQRVDLFVACGTFAHAMAEGARANGLTDDQIQVFDDTPEAGRFIQKWMKPGDVILAKASEGKSNPRGARMERVIKELMADPTQAETLLVRQDESWKRYS